MPPPMFRRLISSVTYDRVCDIITCQMYDIATLVVDIFVLHLHRYVFLFELLILKLDVK